MNAPPDIDQETRERLIDAAVEAMRNAYGVGASAPLYGAAVLVESGDIFASGQYKAGTRQLSLHAEHAALVHAAAHGYSVVLAIAITSNEDRGGEPFTNPCGICKQALYEAALFANQEPQIILAIPGGESTMVPLSAMLSYPWPAAP